MARRQAAACLSALAGDGASVEATLVAATPGARVGGLGAGSLEPAPSLAAAHRGHLEARVLPGARADGLGSAVDRRRDRRRAFDGARDPASATAARARRGRLATRFGATNGRAPGDLLHMDVKRYPRFRRPGTRSPAIAATCAEQAATRSATTTSTPSSTTTPAWPTASCSPTNAAPRPRSSSAPWPGLPRTASPRRLMTDGAWSYTHNRSLRELLSRARDPPHRHAALHAALERQGRALPPDDGTRMGQGPALPQQHARNRACHTGYATTTSAGPTAHSAANHRSAALTTSQGRTARPGPEASQARSCA